MKKLASLAQWKRFEVKGSSHGYELKLDGPGAWKYELAEWIGVKGWAVSLYVSGGNVYKIDKNGRATPDTGTIRPVASTAAGAWRVAQKHWSSTVGGEQAPKGSARFVKYRYSLLDDDGGEATGSISASRRSVAVNDVRREAQQWANEQGASVGYVITDYDGNEIDEDTMEPKRGGKARTRGRGGLSSPLRAQVRTQAERKRVKDKRAALIAAATQLKATLKGAGFITAASFKVPRR
jgi:hypothetical protein